MATTLAFLSLIGTPPVFALAGLIKGLVGAWLFNRFSKWMGKIEVNLDILDH